MTRGRLAVLLTAVAVLGTGCAAGGATAADPTAEVGTTSACAPIERPPLQLGGHLIGDTVPNVPYSSVPPTSGWHASGGGPPPAVYEVPLPGPLLVTALEQGRVVVTHAEPLTRDQLAVASTLVAEVPDVLVTPHELDRGTPPFALVAWGVVQRCDQLDADAVARFVADHGGVDLEA